MNLSLTLSLSSLIASSSAFGGTVSHLRISRRCHLHSRRPRIMTDSTDVSPQTTGIHWFRNGLRLHDNPCLLDACRDSQELLPLFIIDPRMPFAQTQDRTAGCIRANFILESLRELDSKLRAMKSRLIVVQGKPESVLPEIISVLLQRTSSSSTISLYYEREPAAPIRQADALVLEAIRRCHHDDDDNVRVKGYDTHTLHPVERYLALCKGHTAPSTYGGFTKIFRKLKSVAKEVDPVSTCPPLPLSEVIVELQEKFGSDLAVPDLEQLGYDKAELLNRGKGGIPFSGGEDAGVQLLDEIMATKPRWVATFEKPKTSPNALTEDTTGLSPYVKHGCLSPRRFYHELSHVYAKFPAHELSTPPVSLHGQLLWREYNYLVGYSTPNFDRMVGNPVARQIPWDDDPALLAAWRDSRTGFPFIDAIMTQLKETGWIHHLARHAVACFLTRGDLWQSWEQGAAVFEERLIDADWSINNFNWQVCVCFSGVIFIRPALWQWWYERADLRPSFSFGQVVVVYSTFLPILSVLQSCRVWQKDGSRG